MDSSYSAVVARIPLGLARISWRQWLWALVFIALWVGFWQGTILLNNNIGIRWFYAPAGLSVGLMLVMGARAWPLVYVAAVTADLLFTGQSLPAILATDLISPLGYAFYAQVLRRTGLVPRFSNLRDTGLFLSTIPLGTFLPATVGSWAYAVQAEAHLDNWSSHFLAWWIGDMTGIMAVTPFFVLAAPPLVLASNQYSLPDSNARWLAPTVAAILGLAGLMFTDLRLDPTWAVTLTGLTLFLALISASLLSGIAGSAGTVFLLSMASVVMLGVSGWQAFTSQILVLLFSLSVAGLLFGGSISSFRSLNHRLEYLVSERTAEARRKEISFRVLAEGSADVIALYSQHGRLLYLSPMVRELTGYASEDIKQSLPFRRSLVHPDDWPGVNAMFTALREGQPSYTVQYRIRHRNNDWVWLESRARVAALDNLPEPHIVITTRDISGAKRTEDRLRALANQDPLTGCLNRRGFEQAATEELWRGQRYGRPVSLLVIDIDHFKLINDQHGHDVGDQVLDHFANLIRAHCRRSEKFARLGGEEFALLMPETALSAAQEFGERLRELIEHSPLLHVNGAIQFTVSMGLAELRIDDDLARLIKRADAALYLAKADGRNRVLCAG